MDRSHTTSSMWTRVIDLEGTQPRKREAEVVIQEDQDGDLGLVMMKLIYVIGPTLKQSPNLKPTTTVLGTLLQES